jgi:hypothetical protein
MENLYKLVVSYLEKIAVPNGLIQLARDVKITD